MEIKTFKSLNEDFICENCTTKVPRHSTSCRNHCPKCLCSKHVDINPGDRQNPCQGLLRAIDYEFHSKKGLMLVFKCDKCKETTRNISAYEDIVFPDDYDLILKLKSTED